MCVWMSLPVVLEGPTSGVSVARSRTMEMRAPVEEASLPMVKQEPRSICEKIIVKFQEKVKLHGHIGTYLEKEWNEKQEDFMQVGLGGVGTRLQVVLG